MAQMYSTRFRGAPYGRDGERGKITTGPLGYAKQHLHPGQCMECYRAGDDHHDGEPLRRYVCTQEHGVTEVEL